MPETSRAEYLRSVKDRALVYVQNGDLKNAYASMVSDLNKHPETQNHPAVELGMQLLMIGGLNTQNTMREFIEGFN